MATHMKTTIEISEPILEDAKDLARREGVTLRLLVEEGLRSVLAARHSRKVARGRHRAVGDPLAMTTSSPS